MMRRTLFSLLLLSIHNINATPEIHFRPEVIKVSELYTMKVSPDLFNWTSSLIEQFRYRPAMRGKPNLPSWMNFQFSNERNYGYIYGSPTKKYANEKFEIEIVGLNKQTYETRRIIIPFEIVDKKPPTNKIEMKITNLNWVHLTDLGRVENLKGIFINDLWPESSRDINITFMESAVRLGSRVPLKPQNREGVIVHLGSNAQLSKRLQELNEEIKPLGKLSTCTFKKTSVQTIFQRAGFQVDWCAFRIISDNTVTSDETTKEEASMFSRKVWNSPSKDELPERNYSEEIALAVAIPSVWFAFLIALLTVVLCFHNEKFEEIKLTQPVQMVQYSGNNKNPPTTTLKSLHDPYDDNLSLGSQSPSSDVFREGSPQMNASFMRPKPPAYKGKSGESSGPVVHFERDI
ncbi:CLUMA_CG015739, isoform A [Clunio marinus]|uniref:CLUMA_CG015739, isoform A n=1 Tax=Clunio marinus TaxID=568069 RepID=A0A1J1IRJ2_9DIPT|nr:CLUMA_CG015739, isoform A [Clunio marinus]